MRLIAVILIPVLSLVGAAACLYGDLILDNALNESTDNALSPYERLLNPIQLGIFTSVADEAELQALRPKIDQHTDLSWDVFIRPASSRTAFVSVGLGPIDHDQAGQPEFYGGPGSVSGELPHSLDIAISIPTDSYYGDKDQLINALTAAQPGGAPDRTCGTWSSSPGHDHNIEMIVSKDPSAPDIAVCHIPATSKITELDLDFRAVIRVHKLRKSLWGSSFISVTNPEVINEVWTETDQPAVADSFDSAFTHPYRLYVVPPTGEAYTSVSPPASGADELDQQWTMPPGSYMAAVMTSQSRRDLLDVVQQTLLLIAGILLGSLPLSALTAWRALHRFRGERMRRE